VQGGVEMIGDKLKINDYHRQAAAFIFRELKTTLKEAEEPLAVTVAGESGSGKSETASVLAELCTESGYKSLILQQDDYFVYPPKTNHRKREEDIGWVGMQEVKLGLIEENVTDIKKSCKKEITKPLVNYDRDLITEETVPIEDVKVIIIDGTYTTTIKNADLRAFIDRNYRQTKKARLERSRDPATNFLEKVLAIEHKIISAHKETADIIIPPPEDETET
jgi:uridine kinase